MHDSFIGSNCIIGEYWKDFCLDRKSHNHPLIIGKGALIRSGSIIYSGSQIGNNFQTGHQVTIREKSEINIKLKDIKDINSKIKNKIEDMKLKKKNKDLEKNKTDLSEKNKDLKIKIEQKDKIILDLKKKLNEIINGENNFDNSNDIINYNNIIEDLKNKITQINKEIYKQEEAIKLL